jgi:hypothetical protein
MNPPNHYNCRSLLVPITQVDADSWEEGPEPSVEPKGFSRCNHDHSDDNHRVPDPALMAVAKSQQHIADALLKINSGENNFTFNIEQKTQKTKRKITMDESGAYTMVEE